MKQNSTGILLGAVWAASLIALWWLILDQWEYAQGRERADIYFECLENGNFRLDTYDEHGKYEWIMICGERKLPEWIQTLDPQLCTIQLKAGKSVEMHSTMDKDAGKFELIEACHIHEEFSGIYSFRSLTKE